MQKIKDFLYYNRKDVIIVLIFLSLFVGYTILNKSEKSEIVTDSIIQEEIEDITLVVDIKGEVNNPGTYKLNKDERVIDVVNLAGGFTNNADSSSINLSEKVSDEMLIIIPSIEEDQEVVIEEKKPKEVNEVKDGKVSINNGSIDELMTIKGIGLTKAKSIIEYRNKVGKFKSIDEIMYVSGIGKATFEKIKDFIKV